MTNNIKQNVVHIRQSVILVYIDNKQQKHTFLEGWCIETLMINKHSNFITITVFARINANVLSSMTCDKFHWIGKRGKTQTHMLKSSS